VELAGSGWSFRLDGAGRSGYERRRCADLIWEDNSTGQATVHFYGGAGGAVDENWAWLRNGVSAPGWRIAALADFNGSGEPDLVWQQNASPYAVTVNYYGPG